MTALARNTDPITSHEAAAGIDTCRSNMAVLTYLRAHGPEYFTDAELVHGYRAAGAPRYSDSRIRTARADLSRAGIIHYAGLTRRPGHIRREQVWSLDADAATARRIETQDDDR